MTGLGQYAGPRHIEVEDWSAGGQRLRPQWERDLPEHQRDELDRQRARAVGIAAHGMHGPDQMTRVEAKLDELLRRLPPPPVT